ncbi:MAG: PTS sugar transporter subunit IIA [Chlamydiales bacterium]
MDLKIRDVADLLNISETTVRRWLVDGKIPAYCINRQYRFSRSEIEDWLIQHKLEEHFEETQEEHLQKGNMQFSLYRALYRGEVLNDVLGKSKLEVVKNTMKYMGERFDLDPDVLTDLFMDRENMMSTALGHGIAIPHTRDFLLDTHYDVIIVVYPKHLIEYGALDTQPIHTLFFLFASEDRHHLNLLAKIAHINANEKTRAFFSTKPSKPRLLEFVKHWENSLNS